VVLGVTLTVQLRNGWNGVVFIFHPCRVAGLNKSFQLFLKSCGMGVKFNHGWALRKEVKAELEGYKDGC
jgi:hypothetical protein